MFEFIELLSALSLIPVKNDSWIDTLTCRVHIDAARVRKKRRGERRGEGVSLKLTHS